MVHHELIHMYIFVPLFDAVVSFSMNNNILICMPNFCILRYQLHQHNYSKGSHYPYHNNLCRHRVDTSLDDRPRALTRSEWHIPHWNCTSNRQVTAPVPGSEVPGSALRSACSCRARRCWSPYDNRFLRCRNTAGACFGGACEGMG